MPGAALRLLPLLGLLAAAAEPERGPPQPRADLSVLEHRQNATVSVLVQNRAASGVRLANCDASYAVAAGKNVSIELPKLSGLWVVPDGVSWDCRDGPFSLFYLAADLTGPELVASVGRGQDPKAAGAQGQGDGERARLRGAAAPAAEGGVAWVQLSAGAGGAPEGAVGCAAGACGASKQVAALPESLSLVLGADGGPGGPAAAGTALLAARWGWGDGGYGGYGDGGYGGWGHHGYGGWGHHGYGGYGGWR